MRPEKHEHDHAQTPSGAPEILRRAGLRVTAVRVALVELLGSVGQPGSPASAQQIYDELCTLLKPKRGGKPDRVTVYRTLNTLVDAGLAHKVDPGDRVFRFSLTDHARCHGEKHDHEHPHFVCDSCGTVECLEGAEVVVKPGSGRAAPEVPRRLVRQEGVVLHGTCETCVDEPERKRSKR